MTTYEGMFLTTALDGSEWSASRPGRFNPRDRTPGTHLIEGWVGQSVCGDEKENPCLSRASNSDPIAQMLY
jgi:hypothetical protein